MFKLEGGEDQEIDSGRQFLKEGGENTNTTNIDGINTQNNIVDQSAEAGAFSKNKNRTDKVYEIDEDDRQAFVTINSVKKYNRILRGIENGDGQSIDLQGPSLDIYTYSVIMMLNP